MKINKFSLVLLVTFSFTNSVNAFDQSSPPDSLVVDTSGNVGVGTATPETSLHINKEGAKLTVEDANVAVAVRNVIQLKNNGGVGFELRDTNLDNAWDFRTAGNGGFLVSNIGTPGSKLQINTDGSVFLNGAGFILNGSTNNMTIAGNSTALAHISTSSREVKTDFAEVDPKTVMDKIKAMNISEWRYKINSTSRHIGPVAEDFYKLFGLGPDDKHIAASDLASVALIATKELLRENNDLKKRLGILEQLVSKAVTKRNNSLHANGTD